MTTVILFIFGMIVGSFLNVLGLRWNSGVSLGGRSFCPRCGHQLRWYELIPVISFLWQLGRCRACRAKISWQYPVVELWTGFIFATVYISQRGVLEEGSLALGVQLTALLLVFCLYVAISIYDHRHKIIPDGMVYFSITLALLYRAIQINTSLDWLAGPILFGFFALIWLLSSGRAMGFGDAKIALSIGLLLGAAAGFSSVIMAFWIGAVIGIFYLVFSRVSPLLRGNKKITMKSEIPFAPFLVLGAWLSLIFQLDLLHVSFF